ncbi:hypothetical protein HYZ97_02700 [Candidatus Pacearchaeota archaeon]|nr:hypothetical protein [Candidatus Pacearchaeota archaeon]
MAQDEKRIALTELERQALHTDFKRAPSSREAIDRYASIGNPGLRIISGLYRTEEEQEKYIKQGLNLKLPAQR